MKQLLTFALLLLSAIFNRVKAQNGGQFYENNVIRIEYLGYSNGSHTFKVFNKQNCEARIRTRADQDPARDTQVLSNQYVCVMVSRPTAGNVLFRAKAETACISNPDMGWLEVNSANFVLDLKEDIERYEREKKEMKVILENGRYVVIETGNTNKYNLYIEIVSINGARLFQQKSGLHKNAKVDLGYQHRGLVLIKVIIENGPVYYFDFKRFL